ncbi:MAG: M14 family zinc carboxypeptidase [Actinomycetes bacterium]
MTCMTWTSRRTAMLLAALLVALLLPLAGAAPFAPAGAATEPVMKRVQIGTSVKGRPIYAYHRYHPGAWRKVVVIGAIHGDERAGMRVIRRLKRSNPPASLNLWLIPTVNPDGWAADRRTNAHRVDLNRNFPYRWRQINRGTETWSGPSAASEPETKALKAFITKVNPRITVTFHQPLFGVGRNSKRNDVVYALARRAELPVKSFSCSGVCYGSFTSWHNAKRSGVAVTVEFGKPHVSDWRIGKAASAVLTVGSRF